MTIKRSVFIYHQFGSYPPIYTVEICRHNRNRDIRAYSCSFKRTENIIHMLRDMDFKTGVISGSFLEYSQQ